MINRLILLCLVLISPIAMSQTFKVGASQWAPYVDRNAPDSGISIELIQQIFSKQGHEIELIYEPWSRLLKDLDKGAVDILPAVWFKKERLESMIFSEPYLYNRLVFVKAKGDSFEFNSLEDLNDKVIGVVRAYAYDGKILDYPNATFAVAGTLASNLKKLTYKRIDLTLDDEYTIKFNASASILKQLEFSKNALDETPLHVTCAKSNEECATIIKIFNEGLNTMRESGELKHLLNSLGK